ncbi:Transcriptional regulator, AraC family [Shewanella piezotolerans WP3]|uniref:Transcriptional regulator, AraC family n=1 Tax=Shewanella piezotolerans (strain WP3 / JCM 13877) TaxID=225849 RepID=B8CLS6_SHEPW|nr:AraC family transcriptional regulator [Shewanella piezotolerans]ACJ28850.1 Transcriptional regulator, AraC family [Shewanella piezotolerans WP3]
MAIRSSFSRIERVLNFIHTHLDQPLSLEDIAEHSQCSRWQLQRIFQQQTGLNVAQYVRELKLSIAADKVLSGQSRMLDIAYELGFNSEVSFSRSFKQLFGVSPREYQRRGIRVGLRNPIAIRPEFTANKKIDTTFLQTHIEHRQAFTVYGLSSPIKGVLSDAPDFSSIVPDTWLRLFDIIDGVLPLAGNMLGVVDTLSLKTEQQSIRYWAGLELDAEQRQSLQTLLTEEKLCSLTIPSQEYAVVAYSGTVNEFSQLVEWLICDWLPESGFVSLDGYELESYGKITSTITDLKHMEYWLPIKAK